MPRIALPREDSGYYQTNADWRGFHGGASWIDNTRSTHLENQINLTSKTISSSNESIFTVNHENASAYTLKLARSSVE